MLADGQIRLTRSSGQILLGEGTPYTVLPGWDPWSRSVRDPQTMPRPYAHGSVTGAEWMDEAVVLIPVSIQRDRGPRATWMAAQQQLSAAWSAVGATGETPELRFAWGGSEYVMFGRPRQVRVTADNIAVGKSLAQLAFVAADPRRYAAEETVVSTGLPVQSGGLTVPVTVPLAVTGRLVGGRLALDNVGTAPTGLRIRVDGPAPNPRLILVGSDGVVQQIAFDLDLAVGQWIDIDTTRYLALLDGLPQSNQRGRALWTFGTHPLPPGPARLRFFAAGEEADALVTVAYRSAWW